MHQSTVIDLVNNLSGATKQLQSLCSYGKLNRLALLSKEVPAIKKGLDQIIFHITSMMEEDGDEFITVGTLPYRNVDGRRLPSKAKAAAIADDEDEVMDDDVEEVMAEEMKEEEEVAEVVNSKRKRHKGASSSSSSAVDRSSRQKKGNHAKQRKTSTSDIDEDATADEAGEKDATADEAEEAGEAEEAEEEGDEETGEEEADIFKSQTFRH